VYIEQTSQRAVIDFGSIQGSHRLKHTHYQLKYRHLRSSVYTDTLFAKVKSLRQNTCGQIFCTDFQWQRFYPLRSKADAHLALDQLHRDVGVFQLIIPDNAMEMVEGEFKKKALRAGSVIKPVEAYSHNQNLAESAIRDLRRMFRKAMRVSGAPYVLWDHCMELMSEIRSHTALNIHALDGDTPVTRLTGDTADISHLCEFAWYDPVWYVDITDPFQNKQIARYLGPSHDIGQAMCSKLITRKGRIIAQTSVLPMSASDLDNAVIKDQIASFDNALKKALGDRAVGILIDLLPDEIDEREYIAYQDETMTKRITMPEADEYDHDQYLKFSSARVSLPVGGDMKHGRVTKRKRDEDGVLIGIAHPNPLLDTSLYEVEFDDGATEAFAANIFAENVYAKVDHEGNQYSLLDEIVDHEKMGDAINADDQYVWYNGKQRQRRTTKGWRFCVRWKDTTTSWIHLKDLKESNPVDVAVYAVAHKLVSEPAFKWWVPYTLKKKERIIAKIKTRYLRREQKFGITIPKTVQEALQIDEHTQTTFLADAIMKEMGGNIIPALKILDVSEKPPVGSQLIPCRIVFDVKMDLRAKLDLSQVVM
jgi:hypothetical protein